MKEVHEETKGQSNVVRLSIDTKDRVKIGDFSRGGLSRSKSGGSRFFQDLRHTVRHP
ncbi:hypothetical protein ACWIE6_13690 [Paenibacillus taichungensis]